MNVAGSTSEQFPAHVQKADGMRNVEDSSIAIRQTSVSPKPPLKRNQTQPVASFEDKSMEIETRRRSETLHINAVRSSGIIEPKGFVAAPRIGGELSGERIFPIRPVVHSVEPSKRPGLSPFQPSLSSQGSTLQGLQTTSGGDKQSSFTSFCSPIRRSTTGSVAESSCVPASTSVTSSERGDAFPVTRRILHTVSIDGQNLVVTGWDGKLERCEDEPIHAPGSIQGFGVLICFDEQDGRLIVAQVSENSKAILGISPAKFLAAKCLTELLSEEATEDLRDAMLIDEEEEGKIKDDVVVPVHFEMEGSGGKKAWSAYVSVHRPLRRTRPNRFIVEFELKDYLSPKRTPAASPSCDANFGMKLDPRPGMPTDEPFYPTAADLLESTHALGHLPGISRLRRNRKKDGVATTELAIFSLLMSINDRLDNCETLDIFYKTVAGVFREITEFDRAMVYIFERPSYDGHVVAESVDFSRTKDLYRGLHFPASDIPSQARSMYKLTRVRLMHSRDEPTARMVCRDVAEVEVPLDMTHSQLRSMSPIHLKYLGNMGVRSSMSLSIVVNGELFGLVALHHYGTEGHRVSPPLRALCGLLVDAVSKNIERLESKRRVESHKFINTTPSAEHKNGFIAATSEDLLKLFSSDFGCLSINSEAKLLGSVENSQELLALLEYLRQQQFAEVRTTQEINKDFPDIDYSFSQIAGFIVVPLSRNGADFVVFCRIGILEHIRWAGSKGSTHSLEPRTSFAAFSELKRGRCQSWEDVEADAAPILLVIFGRFIDVWRAKEAMLSASRLTSLLLRDASIAVRTPLSEILSCLETALGSGTLNSDSRAKISESYTASKSLVTVINDLLDLTRVESGNDLYLKEPFNLPAAIEVGAAGVRTEAKIRGLTFDIVESPQGTPVTVLGDSGKLSRLISEVASNALRATTSGGILIEWGELSGDVELKADSVRIGISLSDSGKGIPPDQLESMFRAFEHVSTILSPGERQSQSNAVGLGLALCARIVKNVQGQMRVESEVGKGSSFTFVLPYQLPSATSSHLSSEVPRENDVVQLVNRRPSVSHSSSGDGSSYIGKSQIDRILESLVDTDDRAYSTRRPSLSAASMIESRFDQIDDVQATTTMRQTHSLPITPISRSHPVLQSTMDRTRVKVGTMANFPSDLAIED